jgi:hypothetical protein
MADCKAYLQQLGEAVEGGVLGLDARAHVESCRACGEYLRERESLRSLVGGLRKVEAPADFEFRLRARMAASKSRGRRGPFPGLRSLYSFAPVAAAACFLIVSASLYLRQAPRTSHVAGPGGGGVVEKTRNDVSLQSPTSPRQAVIQEPVPASTHVNGASPGTNDVSLNTLAARALPSAFKTRVVVRRMREDVTGLEASRTSSSSSNSLTADLNSAPVITGRTWRIPVGTPAEPLRVIVRDACGAEQVVSMRTVSFGSQELIAREGARRQTAAADDEGVW